MAADRAHGTVVAARRRGNRQLRAFLKNEQMTVAMKFGHYSTPLIHEVRRGGSWFAVLLTKHPL